MSEKINDEENNGIDGSVRSPYTSYTEYLEEDAKDVPDFLMEESNEFLGSEDIPIDRYTSKEFFQ